MSPLAIYETALVLAAVFIAPFNRTAMLIVAAWLVGQVAYSCGLSDAGASMAGYILGGIVGGFLRRITRTEWCLFAVVLYAPMIMIAGFWMGGQIPPRSAYLIEIGIGLFQLVVVALGTDFQQMRAVAKAWRENAPTQFLRKALA